MWPWNLPNSSSRSSGLRRAAGRAAGGSCGSATGRAGPVGVLARGGSRCVRGASRSGGWPRSDGPRRPARRPAWSGLVARPDVVASCRPGPVDRPGRPWAAAGRRAGRPRRSRAGRSARAGAGPARRRGARPARAEPPAVAGQRRVGVVDLGHPPRRDPRAAGSSPVRSGWWLPGEPPPGRLDLGRAGAGLDAEDIVRIALRHASSLSAPMRRGHRRRPARLTGRPPGRPIAPCRPSAARASSPPSPPRPLALAYRFAVLYRRPGGLPDAAAAAASRPPISACRSRTSTSRPTTADPARLVHPGPRTARPGPGVALVHGWESARDRLLPMAQFLHAAGFHCLAFDVRGHGANPAESAADHRRRVRRRTRSPRGAPSTPGRRSRAGRSSATRWARSGRSWPRRPTRGSRRSWRPRRRPIRGG